MQRSTTRQAKQKISANLDHHWSKKRLFLCVQTNWVCPSGTQRFGKMTLTLVSSHWLWLDSSHSVKNVTRVESRHHFSQRDSSRIRVTKNRHSSRWLESRYHCLFVIVIEELASSLIVIDYICDVIAPCLLATPLSRCNTAHQLSAVSAQLWPPPKMLTGAPLMVNYKKKFCYATSRGQ